MIENVLLLHMKIPDSPGPKQEAAQESRLPTTVAEQALRFKSLRRRAEFLAGRMLLAEGLQRLGTTRSLEKIVYSAEGKPNFEDGPFFSISHSRSRAACALSENLELGLDLEAFRPVSPEAFRPWFSPEELDTILQMPPPETELIRRWTVKEALYKAVGGDCDDFPKIPSNPSGPASLAGREWYLTFPDIADGFTASLATSGQISGIRIEEIQHPLR